MKKIKSYFLTIGLILLAVSISFVGTLINQETVTYEKSDLKIIEHTISETKKIIDVQIPSGSKNILVESKLPKPIKSKNAQVKVVNTGKIISEEELVFIDEDKDGFFDKVSWNVSEGTYESFEIELVILNPIEYLKDGDLWQVRFTTSGTGDLSIWSENAGFEEIKIDLSETIDEMEFLNFSCGNQNLEERLIIIDINNVSYKYSEISELDNIKPYKFVIEDYFCEEIGNFNNYMNLGGYAILQFEFANEIYTIRDEAIDPSSFDESRNHTIGYEFLDEYGEVTNASAGETVHIWNLEDNYFFNKTAGIQLTNHFQDYWTRNIFCIGYYNNNQWNVVRCADEVPNFNRNITSDNETYVNATLWNDFTYGGYDLRFGIRYHLDVNDETLSVIIFGENRDTVDIPFPLGFAWRVTDWEIPVNVGDDDILINGTNYPLNGTYDIMFRNMTKDYYDIILGAYEPIPFFVGTDDTEYLRLDWNESTNYSVWMQGDGAQENFSVTWLINSGLFNAGQQKSTILNWIDAELLLQDADTEVLDDDDLYYDGDQAYLVVDDEEGAAPPYGYAHVKFNISNLNASLDIEYAEFCHTVWAEYLGGTSTDIIEIYGVSNYTWVEEDTGGGSTKSLINSQGTLLLQDSGPSLVDEEVYCFNVTDWVRNETRDGRQNLTIGLNLTESSEDSSEDYYTFHSKEASTPADRPYLNVTYEFSSNPIPQIIWENPTPNDGETVTDDFVDLNTSISYSSNSGNTSAWFDWNQTLLGYWSMDYYNSSHILDNSTHGGLGDFVGTGFGTDNITSGQFGSSLLFDGTSGNYIDAWISSAADDIIHNGNITVSLWFKINDLSQSDQALFSFYQNGENRQYIRRYSSSGDIRIWQFINANSNGQDTTGNHITDTNWHHLVWKIEGRNNTLYIDGVYKESLTLTYSFNSIVGTPDVRLGSVDTGTFPLDGNLDEVMYFGRSLSDQEIKALYNNSANRLYNNFTNLSLGTYNYSAYAIDSEGNINITDERQVTLGTLTPSSCQELSTANQVYTLNQNVTSSTTCFNIQADNVTIDCDGYWIEYGTGGGDYTNGVRIVGYDNVVVKNCYILDGAWGDADYYRQAVYVNNSENGVLFNNFMNVSESDAFDLNDSTNYNVSFNSFYSDGLSAVWISSDSNQSYFQGNYIYTSAAYEALSVYGENNTFINNTAYGPSDSGITLDGGAEYNTFIRNNVSGPYAYYITNSNNNNFNDCFYTLGYDGYDVEVTGTSTGNIFTNCSYDISSEQVTGTNDLTRKWYYQAYVNDSAGTAIENANISFYNSTGDLAFTALTNSSGWISIQNLTEYINIGGTRTYQNNFSILANHSDYTNQTEQYNLSVQLNFVNDFFTLTGGTDNTPPEITWEIPTPTDGSTLEQSYVPLNISVSDVSNVSFWIDFNRDLVGYWGFDSYNSTHIYDNSSYKNNGSFEGNLGLDNITSGPRGNALEFDGFSYAVVGQPSELNLDPDDDNFTIMGWMKVAPGETGYLIGKGDSTAVNRQWGIYISGDDIYAYLGGTASSSGENMSDNTWHHVALAVPSTGTGNFYFDGEFDGTSIAKGSATNAYDVMIGARRDSGNTGYGYALNGLLDEILIFNRTLSLGEIQAIYNGTKNKIFHNFTGLDYGTYDYNAYAIDSEGNINIEDYRDITLGSLGTPTTSCQTIDDAGTYILTQNVTSSSGCFNIYVDDVVLDCDDYWINYSTSGGDNERGVYVNATNVTVKNCNIYEGSQGSGGLDSYGIYYNTADNGTIFNNHIETNESAIYLYNAANYNNITSNTLITDSSLVGHGVALDTDSNYNYLDSNTATSYEVGAFFVYDSYYNTLTRNNGTGLADAAGLYSYGSSDHNTYLNNYFTSFGDDYGIYLVSTFNNTLINNTARSDNRHGIWLLYADNNTIINQTSTGDIGIYFTDSDDNIFQDCISIAGTSQDIYYYSTGSVNSNNTFINCSYDSENTAGVGSSLIRDWYYRAYVNNSAGNPIENANISFYNSTGDLIFTSLTGADGFISKKELTEYVASNNVKTFQNNFAILVNHSDYNNQTEQYNLSVHLSFVTDFFTLTTDSDNYLTIIDPTTGDPEDVFEYDNITVKFNFTYAGSNVTSGVTMGDVFVAGEEASIVLSEAYHTYVFEDFETGTQNTSLWDTYQTPSSDARMDFNHASAANGSYALAMYDDDQVTGDYALNVLYTKKDFTGASNIIVNFWQDNPSNGDEQENAPDTWTGFGNYDVVAYTCDGNTWYEIVDSVSLHTDGFTEHEINISADGDFCAEINSSFSILFSQYDNYDLTGDGRVWDDINISYIVPKTQEFLYYDASWNVNVTMPSGLTGFQDLFVNATYSSTTRSDNETDAINYIGESCVYSGSGNWDINCNDNCTISSPVVLDGSNISILGNGHTTIKENITGFQNIRVDGLTGHCKVTCIGGCFQT